jgi:hypothetical protein
MQRDKEAGHAPSECNHCMTAHSAKEGHAHACRGLFRSVRREKQAKERKQTTNGRVSETCCGHMVPLDLTIVFAQQQQKGSTQSIAKRHVLVVTFRDRDRSVNYLLLYPVFKQQYYPEAVPQAVRRQHVTRSGSIPDKLVEQVNKDEEIRVVVLAPNRKSW